MSNLESRGGETQGDEFASPLQTLFSDVIGTDVELKPNTWALVGVDCVPDAESGTISVTAGTTHLRMNIVVSDMVPHDERAQLALVRIPKGETEKPDTYALLHGRGQPGMAITEYAWRKIATIHETQSGLEVRPATYDSGDVTNHILPKDHHGNISILSSQQQVGFRTIGLDEIH
jgi:hypothetical protein